MRFPRRTVLWTRQSQLSPLPLCVKSLLAVDGENALTQRSDRRVPSLVPFIAAAGRHASPSRSDAGAFP